MAVTIADIATLAGISRGTVDRALNDRGRVAPEVAERVKKIAAEQGYQPNRAGKALALARNPLKIGIVIQSVETPFMKLVLEGVYQAREKLEALGAQLLIRQIETVNAEKQLRAIDSLLAEGVNGLALAPVEDERIRAKMDAAKIPIVTFNTDMPSAKRICFVGQDHDLSGRTCAGLMKMLLSGKGRVLVVTGHPSNRAHTRRSDSFIAEIKQKAPEITLLPTEKSYDNDEVAYQIVSRAATEHPDLTGIFLAANGQEGACRALRELGASERIHLICYDITPQNRENTKNGTIDFLIGQDALSQGTRPAEILFDYLFSGSKPERELLYTDIVIKTSYNV